MPGGNVGGQRYKVEKDHFDVLETLPLKLREAIANAPYPFSVVEIAVYYKKLISGGMEADEATDLILARFNKMVSKKVHTEVEKNYGPEHPQAGKEDAS